MKTIILSGLVLFALSSFIPGDKVNGKKENKAAYCLTVSGKVLKSGKNIHKKINVYLIKNNTIIDSLNTTPNTVFSFQLKESQQYSIKVMEPDSTCRLISISTYLPEKVKNNFVFHFDLIPLNPSSRPSPGSDIMDFPIALIYYNPQKGCFDYNRKYTAHIKEVYKQLTFFSTAN